MKRADIKQQVTDKIIAALEKGGLQAWRRPWKLVQGEQGLPYNYQSGKAYQGVNTMMLMVEQLDKAYSSNAWLTYKQAAELGGNVRKGEKSSLIVRYIVSEEKSENASNEAVDDSSNTVTQRCGLRAYSVFNLDQIEGIERAEVSTIERPVDEKVCAVERMLNGMQDNGLIFQTGGNSACYAPSIDRLKMPSGEFNSSEDYAATLAHELVHCTGHKKRLDRLAQIDTWYPDSKEAYAFEELVAELGAAMVCAEHGIVGQLQHESYIESWLRALKNDKSLIFKAARLASAAHMYLADLAIQKDNLSAAA